MPKQLYAKAIEKMCALIYIERNNFNEQGFLLMKKFLSLLSIFAIIAMLFTSCEGGGGGGEGEEGEPTAEGCWVFPAQQPNNGKPYYLGYYLNNNKKYMLYTKDKKTAFYATDTEDSYTVTDKKVRFGGMTYTFSNTKLTQANDSSVFLEKITPSAAPTGKTNDECMTEMNK